jgi:hypothetical protein
VPRARTLLFAVAGGVGNLYWAQPLLDFIARDLHASPATAAWLVTATQPLVIAQERVVRWMLAPGACGFGAFTLFWTALTFLLSAPPYSYPVSVIGLFGLAGIAGAPTAQRAGRLHRGWSLPATGAAWLLALLTFVAVALAPHSVVVVLVAVVTLDIALQALGCSTRSDCSPSPDPPAAGSTPRS